MKQLKLKSIPFKVFKLSFRALFFVASWLFLWIAYGDVLYELQEHSCWLIASPKEFLTLRIEIDLFTYIARACLTIFAIPWLGAMILSIVLSFVEYITDKICSPKQDWMLLSYIPSIALLVYFCTNDMTLLYGHENSTIFKVVLITLAVFILTWGVSYFFKHKRAVIDNNISPNRYIWHVVALIAVFFCVYLYAYSDKEFRTTIAVKYYTQKNQWKKVVSVAEKSGITTKIIAGHRAAALAQMGQIGDRLFNFCYDFPKVSLKGRKDNIRHTNETSSPYMLLYGGLLQPAYHFSFEQYVVYGNYKWALKLMAKSLVLKRDTVLAEKVLGIIDRMPFEGEFVKKFRNYNQHPELMQTDSELAPILDLNNPRENFEQGYGSPLAVNYFYMEPAKNDSQRYQDISLIACLYCKDLRRYAYQCSLIRDRNYIPRYFQEAIAMIAAFDGVTSILKMYNVSPEINASVNNFLAEIGNHRRDPDKGKAALAPKYRGTYIYYYYFENEQTGK